jgi:hypothetical protein
VAAFEGVIRTVQSSLAGLGITRMRMGRGPLVQAVELVAPASAKVGSTSVPPARGLALARTPN